MSGPPVKGPTSCAFDQSRHEVRDHDSSVIVKVAHVGYVPGLITGIISEMKFISG